MDYILEGILKALALLFSSDPETWSVVYATFKTTAMSMSASLALGVPAGFFLGYLDFPGKRLARTVVDTLLALPTVLIGLWSTPRLRTWTAGPSGAPPCRPWPSAKPCWPGRTSRP